MFHSSPDMQYYSDVVYNPKVGPANWKKMDTRLLVFRWTAHRLRVPYYIYKTYNIAINEKWGHLKRRNRNSEEKVIISYFKHARLHNICRRYWGKPPTISENSRCHRKNSKPKTPTTNTHALGQRTAIVANLLLPQVEIWPEDLQTTKHESRCDTRCEDRIFNYWQIFERLTSLETWATWIAIYIALTNIRLLIVLKIFEVCKLSSNAITYANKLAFLHNNSTYTQFRLFTGNNLLHYHIT
jgi:hypothetical protein